MLNRKIKGKVEMRHTAVVSGSFQCRVCGVVLMRHVTLEERIRAARANGGMNWRMEGRG